MDAEDEARPQIRTFTEQDREAVMALAPGLTEGVAPWRDPSAVLRAVTQWVTDSLERADSADHAVFVAEVRGRVVGAVTVATRRHFTGEIDAYVGELIVASRDSHHGVGTALMSAAEDWGRARGLARLSLETGAANTIARGFYEKLGYEDEDVRLSRRL
ncbi:GNAT family N-acetyltransferase [Kribbella sp. NPDC050459]|uniref:GNAT family N-acetyltransferase n=1 Tax=Kribbella sp. NPDC050459 TaxID=3155785 RepID=UPI0033E95C9F